MTANSECNGSTKDKRTVTLAGGCFWCLDTVFAELKGVDSVIPGYTGGAVPNPTYEQVCGGTTGHAEAVQITFDPKAISYREILDVFFSIHDPTTLNRQGNDVGTQYRSAIFYHDEGQRSIAEYTIREMEAARPWDDAIVTKVTPLTAFYPAEDYHRRYFEKNDKQPYCQIVIEPKLDKFRKLYEDKLKKPV
ncbi:MAG: peptide-methionine (S)-S-oxide reductase MsrA [Chloroflexota bacterium]|nr:peptide-methionine (S)-S-oxide reductase MsrA [Chloroflexota bacterium]